MKPERIEEILADDRLRRLIRYEARRYRSSGLSEDDLFQAGVLGSIRAFKTFDESFGASFYTHARFVILDEMRCAAREAQEIALSAAAVRYLGRANRERLKPGASREEVAAQLGVTVKMMDNLAYCQDVRFDSEVEVLSGGGEADVAAHLDRAELVRLIQSRMEAIAARSGRDARLMDVLRRRFGIDPYPEEQSCGEVAAAYGLGASRVSQLCREALSAVRGSYLTGVHHDSI